MEPRQAVSTELARATIRILISWSELKYYLLLALGRGRVLRISISRLSISTRILSIHGNYPLRDSLLHDTNNYGILSRWQSFQLCLLYLRDIFPYSSFRGSRRGPWTRPITPSIKRPFPIIQKGFERPRLGPLFLFVCAGRPLIVRGLVPRRSSNIDRAILTVGCSPRFLPKQFGAVCGNSNSQSSMHLRSRNLPRPSASSPLGNRSHPMANPGQAPDLKGLHQPPFTERILRARISSKFKLPAQLGIYEGKTDPMDHLDSYKSLMSLQGCSDEIMCKAFSATLKGPARNQAILEVEDPSDKVIIMAMMEGLRPSPLFDSLFKNVPETLSTLQSKADKYIAAEELDEAKRRRRGKDDHKRKEPDTRRTDYREETRYKRPDLDPKRSSNRRPRPPPRRPEFILPPLNAPVAQVLSEIKHKEFVKWPGKIKTDRQKRNRNKYCEFHWDHGHNTEDCFQLKEQIADLIKRGYLRKYVADRPPPNSLERRYGDNRPTVGNIQTIHGGFGSGGCSTSSRKRHARSAFRLAEEEIYNLSSPYVGDHTPITFSNDDLRGLHLPHDDALVVSAVIANFNVQRIFD
ncbi:hypothetical protein Acr_23g0013420 [Actinidia rufa]|uniref:Uncharacterized protein n=1 Tax=Actinidia rufa TaxID=165716 RepID=A0A7J0GQ72_9ERIC|nr:hypothetical protein Acr_23g0013420 [Actinidia rufa]